MAVLLDNFVTVSTRMDNEDKKRTVKQRKAAKQVLGGWAGGRAHARDDGAGPRDSESPFRVLETRTASCSRYEPAGPRSRHH